MNIELVGWSHDWEQQFQVYQASGHEAGRITAVYGAGYSVVCKRGELPAVIAGRLRAEPARQRPVVGDWCALRTAGASGPAVVESVLPRRTLLSRKAAGPTTDEQVIAANVDLLIVMMGLDGDYNLARLERYLVAGYESGARLAVVLNKADLCAQPDELRSSVEAVAIGLSVFVISVRSGSGVDELRTALVPGETVAIVGSSGVGKSSLVNLLLGEEVQSTREVRADDDRGRHTTSHRELFVLPGGALLIDTPGMRELGIWADGTAVDGGFEEIAALGSECRFRDCRHESEPGCRVREALERGELDERRFRSYLKLRRESEYLERRVDERAWAEHRSMLKARSRAIRQFKKG